MKESPRAHGGPGPAGVPKVTRPTLDPYRVLGKRQYPCKPPIYILVSGCWALKSQPGPALCPPGPSLLPLAVSFFGGAREGACLRHMVVPRLEDQSELQLPAYTTATATSDPS